MRYIVVHNITGEQVIGPLDDVDFDGGARDVALAERDRLNREAGGQQQLGEAVRYELAIEPEPEPEPVVDED